MSGHSKCTCTPKTTLKNSENMRVLHRKCNYSHFESPKGAWHPSEYSTVICINCPMMYRTAGDVSHVKDYDPKEERRYR